MSNEYLKNILEGLFYFLIPNSLDRLIGKACSKLEGSFLIILVQLIFFNT